MDCHDCPGDRCQTEQTILHDRTQLGVYGFIDPGCSELDAGEEARRQAADVRSRGLCVPLQSRRADEGGGHHVPVLAGDKAVPQRGEEIGFCEGFQEGRQLTPGIVMGCQAGLHVSRGQHGPITGPA